MCRHMTEAGSHVLAIFYCCCPHFPAWPALVLYIWHCASGPCFFATIELVRSLSLVAAELTSSPKAPPSSFHPTDEHAHVHCMQGGQLVWVAPSGGRDRPNEQGDWVPAAFDASAVELMRTLLGKTPRPGHLYPFAMSSWEIMPPPKVGRPTTPIGTTTGYTCTPRARRHEEKMAGQHAACERLCMAPGPARLDCQPWTRDIL